MNITQWSSGELEQFSHKLEEIIHGPAGVDGSVGYIMVSFPIANAATARLTSNCDKGMVIEVLYQIMQGLVNGRPN